MKKVLVIGSKGMLGQELVRVFSDGYEVVGWDLENIDITKKEEAQKKIKDLAPDIIINSAAYNAVDKAQEAGEFEKAKLLNSLAPGYLAEATKELGAIFIQYSTDYVFDGQKKDGYKEDDSPSPISKYGESKLLGEKEVQKIGGKFYLIRLQKLFGRPGQNASAKKSFFETMLSLAETRKELQVVDEELSNFTYAPDLAEQTKYLIEKDLEPGIYHIANEGAPATWYGAAKILFDLAQKNLNLIPVSSLQFPRPAKRPQFSVLINTKLPKLRPWPEALKEFLKN